jgi:hypothetical protein
VLGEERLLPFLYLSSRQLELQLRITCISPIGLFPKVLRANHSLEDSSSDGKTLPEVLVLGSDAPDREEQLGEMLIGEF